MDEKRFNKDQMMRMDEKRELGYIEFDLNRNGHHFDSFFVLF